MITCPGGYCLSACHKFVVHPRLSALFLQQGENGIEPAQQPHHECRGVFRI